MGAAALELEQQAIFENAGQAVHVAFLVMAQEATQDAPLRKALIRAMEQVDLGAGQRHWLDQLRGGGSGTVNFQGLSGSDIRAQCAMITQAVTTKLPNVEMWVLQAKYGQTDFEDVVDQAAGIDKLAQALERARNKVRSVRASLDHAALELEVARENFLASEQRILRPAAHDAASAQYRTARTAMREVNEELALAVSEEQVAQIALKRLTACSLLDNGPQLNAEGKRGTEGVRRRFAFSAERIAAIKGLSEWFAPMFPGIKPLAIDCMLGRMFANHKKIDITARDLANQFGGSHMKYVRASAKMKNHVRVLEEKAIARLEPIFRRQGVTIAPEDFSR